MFARRARGRGELLSFEAKWHRVRLPSHFDVPSGRDKRKRSSHVRIPAAAQGSVGGRTARITQKL